MKKTHTGMRWIAAVLAAVMLSAAPAAVLAAPAAGRTWDDVLSEYPDKEVEILTARLDVTYWRSWQEANAELSGQGMTIEVFSAAGQKLDLSGPSIRIATGQHVSMYHSDYPGGARLFTVVNKGDVIGNGRLIINQLVCMAEDLTHRQELTGYYEMAGDITDNGEVDLMDLAYLAMWLRDSLSGNLRQRAAEPTFIFPEAYIPGSIRAEMALAA